MAEKDVLVILGELKEAVAQLSTDVAALKKKPRKPRTCKPAAVWSVMSQQEFNDLKARLPGIGWPSEAKLCMQRLIDELSQSR